MEKKIEDRVGEKQWGDRWGEKSEREKGEESRERLTRTMGRNKEKRKNRNHTRGDREQKEEKARVRAISNLSDLIIGISEVTQIFLKMPTNLNRMRSWKWHSLFIEALQNCRLDWYFVQNSSKQLSARVCREYRQTTDGSLWWNINMREKSEQKKTNEEKM